MSTQTVTVTFSTQQIEKLKDIAKRQGISESAALAQAIDLSDYVIDVVKDPKRRVLVEENGQLSKLELGLR